MCNIDRGNATAHSQYKYQHTSGMSRLFKVSALRANGTLYSGGVTIKDLEILFFISTILSFFYQKTKKKFNGNVVFWSFKHKYKIWGYLFLTFYFCHCLKNVYLCGSIHLQRLVRNRVRSRNSDAVQHKFRCNRELWGSPLHQKYGDCVTILLLHRIP